MHTHTKIIFKLYLIVISIFIVLRLIFAWYNIDDFSILTSHISTLLTGIKFDTSILASIFLLPFLLLIYYDYKPHRFILKFVFWWLFVLLSITLFIYMADIIYFHHFFVHLNRQVTVWFDDPASVISMIFTDFSMWGMFIPFLVIVFLIYKLLSYMFNQNRCSVSQNIKTKIYYLLAIILIFFSAKGRIIGHHISNDDAFTNGDIVILNKFKINPVYSIIESYSTNNVADFKLMDENKALKFVQNEFSISTPEYTSPIARYIKNEDSIDKKNVVFIYLERKATWKMKYFGNQDNMTPFLDSLFLQSLSFDNFYSGGTRTYEGIYASLFGYPVLFGAHPFKGQTKQYYGLPGILKDLGYQTVFYVPHNAHFDNLGRFFPQNGFDKVYFETDYPKDSIKTSWGVDDHFLYNFALQSMDSLYRNNKAFFTGILTISDHEPYWVPDFITGKNIKIKVARYADWSLRQFFREATKKPWFDNTVFVIFGDHGKPFKTVYETELSSHHIPLVVYYKGITPRIEHHVTGQKDLISLVMNLLSVNYINNTFSENYHDKPYIYSNHYDQYLILDNEFLLIIDKKNKIHGLYKYKDKDVFDYQYKYPEITKKMATYLRSHLQAAKYIIDHNLQVKPNKF